MELINPAEISGKIMTLIDQAEKEIIIVSPYNKFRNWKKLTQRIKKAIERDVKINWYIRKNVDNNANEIYRIGIQPIEIENLHCKMYLNERHAVVTSMNLHEFSDASSIDIGYYITDNQKYNELMNFIDVYIKNYTTTKNLILEPIDKKQVMIKISFFDYLLAFLLEYGFEEANIKTYKNKYGNVVTINNFVENFDLILEPKGNYFRIDLRINYPYKIKNSIYQFLKTNENQINKSIGFQTDFGSQMKRLKLDLNIFQNYNYKEWSKDELEKLKPIIHNLIKVYTNNINDALLKINIPS